jgi:hypothetical protein
VSRSPLVASAGIATTLLFAVSGCGGAPAANPAGGAGPAGLSGAPIQSATCGDWRNATVEERIATVKALQEAAGPKPGQEHGATLPDERAYEIIDHDCRLDVARGFLLYELYNRAASFAPLTSAAP